MRHKKTKLSIILMISLGLTELNAQEAVTASGGNASGSGGSANYSVGQIAYTTNVGSGGSIVQGIQQAFEIFIISGIDEKSINLICTVYPNPSTNYLTLRVESDNLQDIGFLLFDLNGKLLEIQKNVSNETFISMEKFPLGTYLLKVTNNNKEIKIFKIIKN